MVEPRRPKPPQMKPLEFLGSSRDDLAAMPAGIRHDIGLELMRVQFSEQDRGNTQKKIETYLAGALGGDKPTHTM